MPPTGSKAIAEAPPPPSNLPLLLVASFATMVGLAAGLFLNGEALLGASAAAYLGWSVLFGILVLAPYAGRLAKERFLEALSHPAAEDRVLVRTAVARIADEGHALLNEDSEAGKAMRGFVSSVVRQFIESMDHIADGLEGSVKKKLIDAAGRFAPEVQAAAKEEFIDAASGIFGAASKKKVRGVLRIAEYLMNRSGGGGKQDRPGGGGARYGP